MRSSRKKRRGRHFRQPLYSEQFSQPFEQDGGTSVLTEGRRRQRKNEVEKVSLLNNDRHKALDGGLPSTMSTLIIHYFAFL